MMILRSPGINWTWYMHVTTHGDRTCTVEREYRLHNYDDNTHPATTGDYYIVERKGDLKTGDFYPRFAIAIRIMKYRKGREWPSVRTYKLRGGPVERFSLGERGAPA